MADPPAFRVEVAFPAGAAPSSTGLVWDDPTRGFWDSGWTWGSDVWVDVTEWALRKFSSVRGRDRFLDEPQSGSAQFILNNRDRRFDPTAETLVDADPDAPGSITASTSGSDVTVEWTSAGTGEPAPYYGQLVPMRRVRISAVSPRGVQRPVWHGYVKGWPTWYDGGHSEASVQCVDSLAVLAATDLDETVAVGDGDGTGARIGRALDRAEVAFPASRDLDAGRTTLGPTTFGENTLSYVQKVARSENGWLYVAADGTVTFRDRHAALKTEPTVTFGTGGVPVHKFGVDTSADQLWNRIVVQLADGSEAVAEDASSREKFLTRTRQVDTLLPTATAGDEAARWLLGRFAEERTRITHVTVKLNALTVDQQGQVLELDIPDRVSVVLNPAVGGPTMTVESVIEGVSHDCTRADWMVTFALSSADTTPYMRWDDSHYGVWDKFRWAY